jgi:NAD(P)-dependent dehydrogenase (short-subunit alcohol dehydrogenase family)
MINNINAKGTMHCVRAVSKAMSAQEPLSYEGRHGSRSLGRGSIINLGSAASYMASEGMLSYTTSKHAVIGITKSAGKWGLKTVPKSINGHTSSMIALLVALEYANWQQTAVDNLKHQIRVNAICPSWVDTPMMDRKLKEIPKLELVVKKMSPLGRMATVEEVADVIVFMCSPSASYVNGTGLLIDAGLSLTAHTGELLSSRWLSGRDFSSHCRLLGSTFWCRVIG